MKMLSEKEFQSLKISQYEDIPKVMDMECPECHKSDAGGFLHDRSKPVFWCDTPSGFMCVFECPHCFSKFRCHISSTGRYYLDRFSSDFSLVYFLANNSE